MRNRRRSFAPAAGAGIGFILAYFAFIIALIVGWILNIIDLVKMTGSAGGVGEWSMLIWLKVIGIFIAPLGAFLGWFT